MKMSLLAFANEDAAVAPISPMRELGAYEAMWLEPGASFKKIAERFASDETALPSDFVSAEAYSQAAQEVLATLKKTGVHRFGVRIHQAGDYPEKLRDARHPIELLYYQGEWELTETRSVAVVGSRQATEDGMARAARIARELVAHGFTVVSGLAKGIDTAALRAAIEAHGRVIAVIGTPLGVCYPPENKDLQKDIAAQHLLVSQVPVLRYARQGIAHNRLFFPERNATMSALTEATIIVEASDTSGTLTQARAAVHQGRKLFILNSCFENKSIRWPAKFEAEGAVRVSTMEDVWGALG
jgi:DNA processing protein